MAPLIVGSQAPSFALDISLVGNGEARRLSLDPRVAGVRVRDLPITLDKLL